MTVTLRQGGGGELSGSMIGNGVHFQIEGMVEEGTAMGAISNASGGVFFEAYLDGNQLTLILIDVGPGNMPDYSSTQTLLLARTAAVGGEWPPAAGGRPQGNPPGGGGSGMDGLLQGHRCAYSSSPDGGYSTLYRMYFDGQGRFLWGTESSFSGDPGFAYGLNNNPDAGTYQVTGTNRGAAIYIAWPDGSKSTAQVYLGDAQGIYEFQLNGRHFAAALCGGSP